MSSKTLSRVPLRVPTTIQTREALVTYVEEATARALKDGVEITTLITSDDSFPADFHRAAFSTIEKFGIRNIVTVAKYCEELGDLTAQFNKRERACLERALGRRR